MGQVLVGRMVDCAGHLIRLGRHTGVSHIARFSLCWRPLSWWRDQQIVNHVTLEPRILHLSDWGRPWRWEDALKIGWAMELGSQHDRGS